MLNTKELSKIVRGEVDASPAVLEAASHDASLFEVVPEVVVSPMDSDDLKALVRFASTRPGTHLAARSAGTDMSGGPLTDSIVVNMLPHFSRVKSVSEKPLGRLAGPYSDVEITGTAVTEPGVYYRDFDKLTIDHGDQIMPSYPASRELCTVGGIVANNSGGEKTLTYGKTEQYVRRLKMVCADGEEYEFKPLSQNELAAKKSLTTFEGEIYRGMDELLSSNTAAIEAARPIVSKNSCGYYLWNVRHDDLFDLTRMIVGSQGTLGIITEIEFALVKPKAHSHLMVIFLTDMSKLGDVATEVLRHKPESFESYDDQTLKVALRFLPQLMKQMGGNLITLGLQFVPEMLAVLEGGLPKLVLMAEFTGDTDEEALSAARTAQESVKKFHEKSRVTATERDEHKYWVIRRESFNMLRKHIHGVRTAPFIDDFVVPPQRLPEFLPRLDAILAPYKKDLTYTIAGHVGDGNFHIIPLMNLNDQDKAHRIIESLSVAVYELVHEFKGSITGEHNDGIIRTPFVEMQYGEEVYKLFERTKDLWDPHRIFNPGKKVGGTLEYAFSHLVKKS